MFNIGPTEILLIVIVAILVIGPSEMPRALRTAGQWIGKIRRVSGHFRAGVDAMIREAEIEEMEKEWKEKNAKIMADHPPEDEGLGAEMEPLDMPEQNAETKKNSDGPTDLTNQIKHDGAGENSTPPRPPAASAEARVAAQDAGPAAEEPQLPFTPKKGS